MKARTNRCLPNSCHGQANYVSNERISSHNHPKMAFGMSSMDVGNPKIHRNIDDFGGIPFYNHMGN